MQALTLLVSQRRFAPSHRGRIRDAPLNTAALFVGVAASLESLGRAGLDEAELEMRTQHALELFEQLAVAPGPCQDPQGRAIMWLSGAHKPG